MYDVITIGGGPAGLTAAVYALRAGKRVLVIEKQTFGGQITFSPKVENIPGFTEISGNEFAEKLVDQGLANSGDELAVQDIDSEGITIEPGYNIEAYNQFASWLDQFTEITDILRDEAINMVLSPGDSLIEPMDFFDERINSMSPREAFDLGIWAMDFNENSDFFSFDEYGHLISYSRDEVEEMINDIHDDIFRARCWFFVFYFVYKLNRTAIINSAC